jgi:hypothetical protein
VGALPPVVADQADLGALSHCFSDRVVERSIVGHDDRTIEAGRCFKTRRQSPPKTFTFLVRSDDATSAHGKTPIRMNWRSKWVSARHVAAFAPSLADISNLNRQVAALSDLRDLWRLPLPPLDPQLKAWAA